MFHYVDRPNAAGVTRILLLQGPVGPFFYELQLALLAQGFQAKRVVFNAGDKLFVSSEHTEQFVGSSDDWARWLRKELRENWPSFIVLFGAMRPAHRIAKKIAASYGVSVICLEEGYLRSGYVTCEIGGNNDCSPLCEWTPEQPPVGSAANPLETQHAFLRMCFWGTIYYLVRDVKSTHAERNLFHRAHEGAARLAWSWAKHTASRVAARIGSHAKMRRIQRELSQKFVLVPLQVPSDYQLKTAARGWSNERLVRDTLRALEKSQTTESIVFKVHPLDRQASTIRRLIRDAARDLGVSARVHILNSGAISDVVRHATGMIVINSTSAFSALHQNTPTLVLGDAIYRHANLVTLGESHADIRAFLDVRTAASKEDVAAFFDAVRSSALLPGDFYCASGRKVAARAIARKIDQHIGRVTAQAGAA